MAMKYNTKEFDEDYPHWPKVFKRMGYRRWVWEHVVHHQKHGIDAWAWWGERIEDCHAIELKVNKRTTSWSQGKFIWELYDECVIGRCIDSDGKEWRRRDTWGLDPEAKTDTHIQYWEDTGMYYAYDWPKLWAKLQSSLDKELYARPDLRKSTDKKHPEYLTHFIGIPNEWVEDCLIGEGGL